MYKWCTRLTFAKQERNVSFKKTWMNSGVKITTFERVFLFLFLRVGPSRECVCVCIEIWLPCVPFVPRQLRKGRYDIPYVCSRQISPKRRLNVTVSGSSATHSWLYQRHIKATSVVYVWWDLQRWLVYWNFSVYLKIFYVLFSRFALIL
jgi:hypothetical protein